MLLQPDPFPHVVVDGWFDADLLRLVAAEVPAHTDPGWRHFDNAREGKYEGGPHLWGDATRRYFDDLAARTDEIGETFGVADLSMEVIGGGYHLIPPGGRLAVHTDFNRSPHSGRYRRVNVLTYLNDDWADPGGLLILRDRAGSTVVEVVPEFGRTVMFETSDASWHGHPAPASRWRLSVAAYFFSTASPPGYRQDHSTVFL